MNTSQTGVQLRQRGLGIAGGGLVLMLVGVAVAAGDATFGGYAFAPLLVAAGACVLSFTQSKDHTGLANGAAALTVLVTAIAAIASSSWTAVLPAVIGAVVVYVGNKQLAAGTRSG
ncbi:hypothetical protein [Mycolicibacterium sp.]|uniref:hypothetical protein n=1 Tax=Mycolicibacterium sp. TaxID=2320850 RepID=UPI0037C5DAF5